MDATAVLEQARQSGIFLKVEGERLLYRPRHAAPPDFVDTLRQHKAEVMALLQGQAQLPEPGNTGAGSPPKGYRLKYPEGQASQQELKEIEDRVHREGFVLLWSNVLADLVAYVREDFTGKVPPGFVIYTSAELEQLFGGGKHPSPATQRLIHEAKKHGGRVAHD